MRRKWINASAQERKRHRYWGAKKIQARLLRRYGQAPATATIARWPQTVAIGQSTAPPIAQGGWRRRPPLLQARAPNHIWTVDFKVGFALAMANVSNL